MKTPILLLALSALVLASCTTAYKTGQTPDDVYYSPVRPEDESVKEEREDERRYSYNDEYYDDRYLRMKVRNRYRWNDLDDWYITDRYSVGYNYYYGSFNNPYNRWNYYYNPYCCCLNTYNYVFVNPKTPAAPPVVKRHFNLAGYTNNSLNNSNNPGMLKTSSRSTTTTKPVYNNSNSNTTKPANGLSNKVRTIFSNDNSGSRSSRTYTPSSSSGSSNNNSGSRSSSSSGGSSGGGVSRPTRN